MRSLSVVSGAWDDWYYNLCESAKGEVYKILETYGTGFTYS
jgi:hypothetical protein